MNWKQRLHNIKSLGDFSWEEVAQELGVSYSTLSKWLYAGVPPSRKSRRKIEELERRLTERGGST